MPFMHLPAFLQAGFLQPGHILPAEAPLGAFLPAAFFIMNGGIAMETSKSIMQLVYP